MIAVSNLHWQSTFGADTGLRGEPRRRVARAARIDFPTTLAVALIASFAALACSQPRYDLRRPFEEAGDLTVEIGQVGDTTRPFVRFRPGAEGAKEIALGPVHRGFLRTYLALDPGAGGAASAVIELRGEGLLAKLLLEEPRTCRHRWPPGEERQSWEECLLPIRHDYGNATLRIEFEGPEGAELRVSSPILVAAAAAPKPNVFVIVLDTARADVFSTFNDRVPIGARLDALARDAIVFDDLHAPSSWTRASVATLITGLPPTRHQVFDRLHLLSPRLPTLQSHLRSNGYVTLAWSTNPNILPIWGFARDFDEFADVGVPDWKRNKADASRVFERVRASVEANRSEAAFYYLHFMDPHHPYLPPAEDLREVQGLSRTRPEIFPAPLLSGKRIAKARGEYERYLAEIRDFDAQIGSFFDFLKDVGLYEDSLILLVSDHGEEFLEHGGRYHGRNLYEESLRVPGFLKLPGNARAGTRIARPVGLVDLLPTITARLGLPAPPGVEGSDVLDSDPAELPGVAELVLDDRRLAAVNHRGWKLIVDYQGGGVELYDLVDDPGEQRNLADEQPEKVSELRVLLDRMTAIHAEGWHLRGCGCRNRHMLRLQIRAAGAEIGAIGLEDGDGVAPRDGNEGFDVAFDLAPTISRQERFGRAINVVLPDEDEISLRPSDSDAAGAPVGIHPGTAEGLRFALGNGELRDLEDWLDLRGLVDAAELEAGEPANCRPPAPAPAKRSGSEPETCEPYVRIWYVAPPRAVSESTVDPSISERLKALGYTW